MSARDRSGVVRDFIPANFARHDLKHVGAPQRWTKLGGDRHELTVPPDLMSHLGGYLNSSNLHVLNPSIVSWQSGRMLCAIRLYDPRQWHAGRAKGYVLGDVTPQWKLQNVRYLEGMVDEDLRLFVHGSALHAIGTDLHGAPPAPKGMAITRYNQDYQPEERFEIACPQLEKNWMPAPMRDGRLKLVYRAQPLVVLDWDGKTAPSPAEAARAAGHAAGRTGDGQRGSSALLPYSRGGAGSGGFIAVVHERVAGPVYVHRFATFDEALTDVRFGPPFVFEHEGLEFCAGLAWGMGHWVLSYGRQDKVAMLATLTEAELQPWLPAERLSGIALTLATLERGVLGLPGWCTPVKAARLFQIASSEIPEGAQCVELGVHGGRSLLALAMGLQQRGSGHVVGLDPYTPEAALEGVNGSENDAYWRHHTYSEVHEAAEKGLLGVKDFARIQVERSQDAVGRWSEQSLDLLHQDANHSEETSVAEVRAWLPKLKVGGLWISDDTDWPTTQTAQFLLREAGCELLEDHTTWRIYRKVRA